jgi:hypothetical protein
MGVVMNVRCPFGERSLVKGVMKNVLSVVLVSLSIPHV